MPSKTLTRTLIIAACAATLGAVQAPAAFADEASVHHCRTHHKLCLFDGLGGAGDAFVTGQFGGQPDLRHINTWLGRVGFNDRTESIINNTNLNWCFYRDINYRPSPPAFRVRPHGTDIVNLRPEHRNLASSYLPCDI